jgi:hypothetical protein
MAPLALILAIAASQPPRVAFRCETTRGLATVETGGGSASYRFRSSSGRASDVPPVPARGVFKRWSDIYGTMETQIRFAAGDWTYTVHSIDSRRPGGTSPSSGVQVRRGRTVVANMRCRGRTRLLPDDVLSALPGDPDPDDSM